MTGLVWVALDGVGHPLDAPPGGPWETDLPTLRPLVDAGMALDARLGVPGLPQSATGQATWLTGENAARLMGHHYGPQPGPTLRALLDRALPVRVVRAGGTAELLNVYPPGYFTRRRPAHGCFAQATLLAGRPLNPPGVPLVSPLLGLSYEPPWTALTGMADTARLGESVALAARHADLLMIDVWFSDALGHRGSPDAPPELHAAARDWLRRVDALLHGLLHAGARVVVTSDHGNFEDLSVKTHTLARVPLASNVTLARPASGEDADIAFGGRTIAALLGAP